MGNHNQNRHIPGIIDEDVYEKLMRIFEMIGQVPSLGDLYMSFKKILKPLIETTNFSQNFTNYIERL